MRRIVHGKVPERMHGAADQGERGEHPDERGAQRRREEDTAVTVTMLSNRSTSVPSRHRR